MRFFTFNAFLACCIASIHASESLVPPALGGCACANQHNRIKVRDSMNAGVRHVRRGDTVGDHANQFPHHYNNQPASGCPGANNVQEWPILIDDREYNGYQPGNDRVLFTVANPVATGQVVYCGCVTHQGVAAGQFRRCGDTALQPAQDIEQVAFLGTAGNYTE